MLKDGIERWHTADAEELYEIPRWGQGYFRVAADGRLMVHPHRHERRGFALKQLVDDLRLRGVSLPVLLRFNDILDDRMETIREAFGRAIREHRYPGGYTCIYPIKVNQQRPVVDRIARYGAAQDFGVEAGSKPELLALMASVQDDRPIICNGFKDAEFIETALLAQKLGRTVLPVVERLVELPLILRFAEELDIRPRIGIRVKLAARGSGRWQASAGYGSKFGLTVGEVLCALELLHERDMSDCFELLHFHLGSQITNIRRIKGALIEAARIYADLAARGAGLKIMDVGGGLGVDYDGSQTDFESSINYTLQEYANDVVYHVQNVCEDAGVAPPNLMSESGRAIAAYHSVLVFEVLGASRPDHGELSQKIDLSQEPSLRTLRDTDAGLSIRNLRESFHDAQEALDMVIASFCSGHASLDQRAAAEQLFFRICRRIRALQQQHDEFPDELGVLPRMLASTYFCNLSVFQSLPDSWAIKQIFPVVPIHRLDEEPTQRAVLGDITCDSDGKIDRFIDRRGVARTLPVHEDDGQPYHLAAFLVGAYQEILGDLHNLFGDTTTVHVGTGADGRPRIETIVQGDTTCDVLRYVQYEAKDLMQRIQTRVEEAISQGRIDHREAGRIVRFFDEGLRGYTYLK